MAVFIRVAMGCSGTGPTPFARPWPATGPSGAHSMGTRRARYAGAPGRGRAPSATRLRPAARLPHVPAPPPEGTPAENTARVP